MLTLSESGGRIERYWNVKYGYHAGRSRRQIVVDIGELIDDAVRIHCRSDAALGCHLSGGLDSSLVGSLGARHRGALDAFSVRFGESAFSVRFGESAFYDESAYASAVAKVMGARHHIITPEVGDLTRMLGPLTWHQEFPSPDAGGFSYFSVSRLAAHCVKVALTGHGGDEVFGGYPWQVQTTFGSTGMFDLSKWPPSERATPYQRLGRLVRRQGVLGLARRLLPSGLCQPINRSARCSSSHVRTLVS